MKRIKLLTFLCLSSGIPSYTIGQKFVRQVYVLSDHFVKEKCEVDAPCDCCASELIFLTKRKFALVDRCLYNDTYLYGRYTAKKAKLVLNFKPKVVSNRMDEKTEKMSNEIKEIKMEPLTLQISTCAQDKIVLEHKTIKEYKYGSRQSNSNEKQIIKNLKGSTVWKLLKK